MPRILRQIHEYYDNRVVNGLRLVVLDSGNTLRVLPGSAVVDEALVSLGALVDFHASDFIIDENKLDRTDIIVMDSSAHVTLMHGVPGEHKAPTCPALSILLAQVSIQKNWKYFIGHGALDEVLSVRSEHVIDTRFAV